MYPCVFGHEIIGEVTVVGDDVKHLSVGDRVGVGAQVWACLNNDPKAPCEDCADGENAYCNRSVITYDTKYEDGSMAYGGYADYVRVDSNFAFKIPDNIPSASAAPLLCAGATVYTPLKHNVKPGDHVGVIGIGGLGHLAIQFIRALGAMPIAFSRSANKEKEVLALGAEEFYNLSDPVDEKKAVNSVNVLLLTADATNMPYNTYLSLVKKRGTLIMVGVPNDDVKFKPMFVVAKGIKWVGSLIGSIQDIKDMLALASEKNVRAVVQQMPMSKVNDGIAMVREGLASSESLFSHKAYLRIRIRPSTPSFKPRTFIPPHAMPTTFNGYAAFDKTGMCKPWQFEPRPLGSEDVEIKISHCGICGSDVHTLDSGWGPTPYPCVAGHEIVGEVTTIGTNVKNLAVGNRVGVGAQAWACLNRDPNDNCRDCADGEDAVCDQSVFTINAAYKDGSRQQGGFADYVRVDNNYAFKIPEALPSDVAAPLLCAGATVFTPLKQEGVKAGDRVGVIGIGGLGHIAIQFIRALGATPIAFSRSANKEQEIRSLGAEEFYNLSDPEDQKKAAGSVDFLLLTADAADMPYDLYLGLVRKRGTFIMVGLPPDQVKITPWFLVPRAVRVRGSAIGSIADIKDMLELAAKTGVRPIIQKLPMTKVNEGLDMVRDSHVRYRVVLEN
ncbi:hypothetical protein BBJ29_007308 [Phytophthora kernoviae]|uniref:Enoyl reductase (ER) domain-containing protein n=2 Tax=Phytophthora kernoviae TaxID=325452 RepID=A0A3R7HJV0_9STRA|nr:hypothetical protein BBJ29_007308 [Phytophthora kernoviae]